MWILDADTGILGGHRQWLRPGTSSILGRTNFENQTQAQKVISRKHVVLTVETVPTGSGLTIRHHAKLSIRDESKKGSTIDGRRINQESVTLDNTEEHTLQLATAPDLFRIRWEPQVITVHVSGKKKANLNEALKRYLDKLEALDIKTVSEFLPGTTTIVVVAKRNVMHSLRALINGAWIVTAEFVDAIAEVAKQPVEDNGEVGSSPLQEDVVENWPDALKFLPPPGQEPNPKSPEFFRPNPARKTMFEKWVLVCLLPAHMDTFTGVVTDAGGKIELFELQAGKTKPAELVVHVERLGQKYIILASTADDPWYLGFQKSVEARTGRCFAIQNEFLDAILLADPKILARDYEPEVQVPESVEVPSVPPSTEAAGKDSKPVSRRTRAHDNDKMEEAEDEPVLNRQASTSGRRSQTTQSRTSRYISQVKNDDSDDDFIPLPAPSSANVSAKNLAQAPRGVSSSQAGPKGTQLSVISETQGRSQGLKKRGVPSDDEDDDVAMDKILPGQAAMKRRKIEEETGQKEPTKPVKQLPSALNKKPEPPKPIKPEPIEEEDSDGDLKPAKGKKKATDTKVIKTAQEIRKREEAEAALDDAAYEMTTEEVAAVSRMRDLAIVEVFEVAKRAERPMNRSQAYGDEGARWDENWNGRKNFKKFKRRTRSGDGEGPMRRIGGHIMISLIEHKAPDYGIGESYWLESANASKKRANANQSSNNLSHVSETQVLLTSAPKSSGSRRNQQAAVQVISSDAEGEDMQDADAEPGRMEDEEEEEEEEETHRDEPSVRRSQATRSQAQGTQSGRTSTRTSARHAAESTAPTSMMRSKRTTSNRHSASEGPVRKKTKTNTKASMFANSDEDSDDDDELKFKFK